ncbi:uncharacterized protein LOC101449512 [Ceratitis capitata]|uniref:uncharacterized protein LOC101449512 n=1 Tax=Ceratitis capitata TaxID=7213 RepID=UPI000A10B66E|nr:uncharacterized protein LOC101449512 [Ceratitis capitata]XP_020714198.1 uncharacterized protein LOC101449512 [Ceratitis capitata]
MSISKLRSRHAVLTRQEHIKSPSSAGGESTGGGSGGVCRAIITAAPSTATTGAGETHKTAKSTTHAATTKLPNAHTPTAASNATTATSSQQLPSQPAQSAAQTHIPQTSLLKIEPFIPSLTTRLRRTFGRSYTTLSHITGPSQTNCSGGGGSRSKRKVATHSNTANALNSPLLGAAIDSKLAKANAASTRAAIAARLRRNPVRAIVTRQRSKSTSSSASNRPTTAHRNLSPNMLLNSEHNATTGACTSGGAGSAGSGSSSVNGGGSAAIVTVQPNGICRITRAAQERENQPDRINYDRRGLSALPIFEHETQLRLLSLQHNLINIFHIPKDEPQLAPVPTPSPPPPSGGGDTAQADCCHAPDMPVENVGGEQHNSLTMNNSVHSPKPVRRQNERATNGRAGGLAPNTSGAGVRLSLALGTTNARQLNGNTLTPPPPPPTPLGQLQQQLPHAAPHQIYQQLLQQRLAAGGSGVNGLKNLHYNGPLLPMTRQPTPTRFALKRSKSFVTNIPRHLQSIQQNMLKTQLARVKLGATAADARLQSFDSTTSASGALSNATDSTASSSLAPSCSNTNGTTFAGSEFDEDDPLQQLTVKNRQLVASYGTIFQSLVFLDLYDNQIERIGNLDGLPALSVLLLGKNRLTDISGLASLKQTLRVLDLHGNKIASIANKLNCLQELKSLNLAGNLLRHIGANDFNGLTQLRELNLKRNKIKRINGFEHLTALERLWLCHNELHRVDDMASIAKAINLLEVTIENNPVSLAGDCVSFLVSYLPRLQTLSQMPITEQVRTAAMSWRRNKEISDTHYANLTPDAYQSIKREEVISNARTNWELLRSQQTLQQTSALQRKHTHKSQQQQQQQQLLQTHATTPRIAKTSELARINESNEAVGDAGEGMGAAGERLVTVGYGAELQEFIKLPPIQQREGEQQQSEQPQTQTQGQTNSQPTKSGQAVATKPNTSDEGTQPLPPAPPKPTTKAHNVQPPHNVSNDVRHGGGRNNNVELSTSNNNSARLSGSSGSSLGPNVHSSSSCFSSDNEDSTELTTTQQRTTRIHKYQKTAGQQHQQQRRGRERGGHGDNKECRSGNAIVKRKIDATQKANDLKQQTIEAAQPETELASNKVTTLGVVGREQMANINAEQVTNNPELVTLAEGITAKQTTNDANPKTACDTAEAINLPTQVHTHATDVTNGVGHRTRVGESISPSLDSSSSMLMHGNQPNRTSNASKTMLPQQKLSNGSTTTTIITSLNSTVLNTTTAQITNHASLLSLGFKEHSSSIAALPLPQQTNGGNGSVGAVGFVGTTTRTTCRRLTRSQTIVGASSTCAGTNNCLPTAAANNGNESCGGRRTANSASSKTANTNTISCNGQASAQPTVTCIVAPTPIGLNNSNASQSGRGATTTNKAEGRDSREREREREQGGDYLIEICGRYLNVYGQGALRYIDKQWNAAKAQDVHTLNFSYINFNNIAATVLARVKARFPNAENFVFRETNIEFIGQLNALAELQGISTLTIDPEGNTITTKDLWREYAIYRLSHWGLKLINGVAVTEADIEASNALYEGLSDLVLWAMPASMLQPLLARLRLDETCTASKMSPKEWLMKPENKSLRLVVGKEALQWKKPNNTANTNCNNNSNNSHNNNNNNGINGHHQQAMPYAVSESSVGVSGSNTHTNTHTNANANLNTLGMRERGRLHFATMLENTVDAVEKVHMLETLWPSMLLDIVRNALLDYSHLDEYLHSVMDEIMK